MSEQAGRWYELTTWADSEAIESVAELFARYGYNEGVSIEEPFLQEQDGDNLRIDSSKPAVIRTYIPAESYDPATVDRVYAAGADDCQPGVCRGCLFHGRSRIAES